MKIIYRWTGNLDIRYPKIKPVLIKKLIQHNKREWKPTYLAKSVFLIDVSLVFKGVTKKQEELLRYYLFGWCRSNLLDDFLDCDYCEETDLLSNGLKYYIVCFFQIRVKAKLGFWRGELRTRLSIRFFVAADEKMA